MKTIKTILVLCVALCFATSCKKEVDMTLVQKPVLENADIREIEVSDAWQVAVVADSNTFVELEFSAYLEPYVKANMEGTKLELGFSGNVYPAINSVYHATIHMNKIEKIKAEDAAQIVFSGRFSATSDILSVDLEDASTCSGLDYSGNDCKISIQEASHFLDFQLSVENCEVKVSDASTCKGNFDMTSRLVAELSGASQCVTFGGSAPYGTIKLQDASLMNMVKTQVDEMHVDLSGASEATIHVTEKMSGSLTDASVVYYKGAPNLNVDCSDGSQLIPF